jgi:hypothetical protein
MNINTKTTQIDAGKRKCHSPAVFALAVMGVIGSLGMANTAQAVTLYQTGFEYPPFALNSILQGQDGWVALPSPPFSPDAATITNTKAKKGSQSVVVPGVLLDSQAGIDPYDGVGIYRRPLNGGLGYDTLVGNNKLARVDADLMLDTPRPKTPGEFFSLTIGAVAGDRSGLGEIGLSSKGEVEAWAADANPGDKPKFTKPISFNKWHHITLLLDFANRTTSYFIDEHFLGSVSATSTSTVLLRGTMGVFRRTDNDQLSGPNSVRSDYTARFDNFRISVHKDAPEID